MPILNPYKSEKQFHDAVDAAMSELESFFDLVLDFDYELKEPIGFFKELLKKKPSKDNCYAVAKLLDYFFKFKQQLVRVKKLTTKYNWEIEPYFNKFCGYKHEEFILAIVDLEEEVLRYEKLLDAQIQMGIPYLKENDADFSL